MVSASLQNDPMIDPRFFTFLDLVKQLRQKQVALFSAELTLFADPNRNDLPTEALDELKYHDDEFIEAVNMVCKALENFFREWRECDPSRFDKLKNSYEYANERLRDVADSALARINAATAQYLHQGLVAFANEDVEASEDQLNTFYHEVSALSFYGDSIRKTLDAFRELPELPFQLGALSYQASIATMIIVIVVCLGISQFPTILGL